MDIDSIIDINVSDNNNNDDNNLNNNNNFNIQGNFYDNYNSIRESLSLYTLNCINSFLDFNYKNQFNTNDSIMVEIIKQINQVSIQNNVLFIQLNDFKVLNQQLQKKIIQLENEKKNLDNIIIEKSSEIESETNTNWTKKENQLFLDSINKFGQKNIYSISLYVGTKTPSQVKIHAEKYYRTLEVEIKKKINNDKNNFYDFNNNDNKII